MDNNKMIYEHVGKKYFLINLTKLETLRLKTISEIEREEILSEAFAKYFITYLLDIKNLSIVGKANQILLKTKPKKIAKINFDKDKNGFVFKNVEYLNDCENNQIQEKLENTVFNCNESDLLSCIDLETGYKCSKSTNTKEKLTIILSEKILNVGTIEIKYSFEKDMLKISKDICLDEYKLIIEKILSKIDISEYTCKELLLNFIDVLNKRCITAVTSNVAGNMYDIYNRIPKYFPKFKDLSEETKISVMDNACKKARNKEICSCSQSIFYQLYKEVPHVLYTLHYQGKVYNKFFNKEEYGVPIWIGYTYQSINGNSLKESFMCHTLWLLLANTKK